MSERIVYVKRGKNYQSIPFGELATNEPFILCESDGTPVGYYIAICNPSKLNGVSVVEAIEVS